MKTLLNHGNKLLFCILSGALLAGCGQTGSLYLPKEKSVKQSTQANVKPAKQSNKIKN